MQNLNAWGRGLICFEEQRIVIPIMYDQPVIPPTHALTRFNRLVKKRCERKHVAHTHAEAVEASAIVLEQSLFADRDARSATRLGEAVCLLSHLTQLRNWMIVYPYSESLFAVPGKTDFELMRNANVLLKFRLRQHGRNVSTTMIDTTNGEFVLSQLRKQIDYQNLL